MKKTLSTLCFMVLAACGGNTQTNSAVKDAAPATDTVASNVAPTSASLEGNYAGKEDENNNAACQVAISIANAGLFRTPTMTVKVDDQSFSTKVSAVDAALQAMGSNDSITLTTSQTTGILSSQDSTLQLLFTNGAVSGLHFQTAAFSGGFIQGQWTVIDCNSMVAASAN